MEKIIKLIIHIDDDDELLCGKCFSKIPIFYGSGIPDYRCRIFSDNLKKSDKWQLSASEFYEFFPTERCSDCLLISGTKKKYMGV